jgi:predicted Rossmann fold flavoprotein
MSESFWDVVVVGAGAAGLLAAARSAERGRRTLLLEKSRKPGVKILISGGTRCNITHATDNRGIVEAFGPPGRFLHSALAALSVQDTLDLFAAEGVPTKTEQTGKIFPESNRATDVLAALLRRLDRSGATLALGQPVRDLKSNEVGFSVATSERTLSASQVILTSGGQSYPGCGTTGDGYALAGRLGHRIVAPAPALVPLAVAAPWVADLRGITVTDVALDVRDGECSLARRRGSFLFTHFGLSGPAVLDVSRVVSRHPRPDSLQLAIDFLPSVDPLALDEHIRTAALASGRKQLSSVLGDFLPRRLCDTLLSLGGVLNDQKAAGLTKSARRDLVRITKDLRLPITGTLGFNKAEVTAGGIALDEVDSRTMRSKIAPNLYIAGEVLDLDGPIGGFNFQAAWSTGWLAGNSVGVKP